MALRVEKWSGLLASVFLVAFACGCGSAPDRSGSGTTNVVIVIGSRAASSSPAALRSVLPRAIPAGVARVRVTVSASDITTIVDEVSVAPGDNSVTLSLEVPNGTNRLFVVEVFDASLPATLLYRGEAYANLSGNPADGSPVEISVLLDHYFASLASGAFHNIVVKPGGEVWAFGQNESGQLGNTSSSGPGPVQVMGAGGAGFLGGVKAVSGGLSHTVALKHDGTVWTWGSNDFGQLGDGTTDNSSLPVQVVGPGGVGVLNNVIAVAAGIFHTVALKSDGTVWAWGGNGSGQLGDGTPTDRYAPVRVEVGEGTALTNVSAIAAGETHTIALKDGTIWTWGDNRFGQLGDGSTVSSRRPVPVSNPGGPLFLGIAGGDSHSVALKSDGTVWAWGYNEFGQLGDGTVTDRYIPVRAGGSSFTGVQSVSSGGFHSIALKSDGTVWTWGDNFYGQLGDATNTERWTPVRVVGAAGTGTLADVHGIAGGYRHTVALKNDGTVWAWGNNGLGQLGVGPSVTERLYPGKILGF